MGAICKEPAWQNVPVVRAPYMHWAAEYRLRKASWYSYHTTVRTEMEPVMQVFFQLLHAHMLKTQKLKEEVVADGDWV